eukprot:m.91051 g.91051  ORF g.91051 m.91051 type:complete len:124 (-) comp12936_c1_seq1:91-462(-)
MHVSATATAVMLHIISSSSSMVCFIRSFFKYIVSLCFTTPPASAFTVPHPTQIPTGCVLARPLAISTLHIVTMPFSTFSAFLITSLLVLVMTMYLALFLVDIPHLLLLDHLVVRLYLPNYTCK